MISLGHHKSSVLFHFGIAVLSLAILVPVRELWKADLGIPFTYWGDSLTYLSWIKGIIQNGWWLQNKFLGAPFGQQLYDFPYAATATLQMLILKVLGMITGNHWLTQNLYFILTFALVALTSSLCLRAFGASRRATVIGSVLYTFLPYHFFRGTGHLFSSGYFSVPLAVMLMLWIARQNYFPFGKSGEKKAGTPFKSNRRFIAGLVIAPILAMSDVYYAFFGSFLIITAGLYGAIARRRKFPLFNGCFFVLLITSILLLNLLPTIRYHMKNGSNPEIAVRHAWEADFYGLRIAQMLLPVDGHRLPYFRKLKENYTKSMIGTFNENRFATLGLMGSIGFFALLFRLLLRQNDETHWRIILLNDLSVFNVSALLFATIGGFGTLFALLVSPQIRCYNRISVYIAFFSLMAVSFLFDQIFDGENQSRQKRLMSLCAVLIILVLGISDQTTSDFVPDYAEIQKQFETNERYFTSVERSLPKGSMIFQLPNMTFPEYSKVNRTNSLDQLKAYLHTKDLRWSFGALQGRKSAIWQEEVADQSVEGLVRDIAVAGFAGVLVDRNGYKDRGADLLTQLKKVLTSDPLVSPDSQYAFFTLENYRIALTKRFSEEKLESFRNHILNRVLAVWRKGFYGLETRGEDSWRWCQSRGVLLIKNYLSVSQDVQIRFKAVSGHSEPSGLKIESSLFNANLIINGEGADFSRCISVPPGIHEVRFSTDAKAVYAPRDRRSLFFRLQGFELVSLK